MGHANIDWTMSARNALHPRAWHYKTRTEAQLVTSFNDSKPQPHKVTIDLSPRSNFRSGGCVLMDKTTYSIIGLIPVTGVASYSQLAPTAPAPDKMTPQQRRGPQFGWVRQLCNSETRIVPDSQSRQIGLVNKTAMCSGRTCAAAASEFGNLITWYRMGQGSYPLHQQITSRLDQEIVIGQAVR